MTAPQGSHLSSSQLTELRAELERELVRLRRSMASTAVAARPVELDQTAVGRVSRADALQNQQLSADLHSREQARLSLLTDAIERMDRGEYGACQRCGAAIPFGRLVVLPEARTCAACSDRP